MIYFQEIFLSEAAHFLVTLGIALILFWRFQDWRLIVACLLAGIFIDIDHLLDYFLYYGFSSGSVGIKETLADVNYFDLSEKVIVFFHGWEFVPLTWILGKWLGIKLKIRGLEWALALSYFGHLLVDHFSFPHHPLGYSFVFRLLNKFSQKEFDGL
jgi:hypothetical protein